MSYISKILGQSNPGTWLTPLYVVPNGYTAAISVIVCNRSASSKTYRISLANSGEADSDKQYISYDTTIPANETHTISNLALRAADEVRVYASTTEVSFTALGSELG